jgi:hypothetical protein
MEYCIGDMNIRTSEGLQILKSDKRIDTLHKIKVRSIDNDGINSNNHSICNGSVMNYDILAEDVKYLWDTPECYATYKFYTLSLNV